MSLIAASVGDVFQHGGPIGFLELGGMLSSSLRQRDVGHLLKVHQLPQEWQDHLGNNSCQPN